MPGGWEGQLCRAAPRQGFLKSALVTGPPDQFPSAWPDSSLPTAPGVPSVLGVSGRVARPVPSSKTTAGLTGLSTRDRQLPGPPCLPLSPQVRGLPASQPRASLMEEIQPGQAQGTLGAEEGGEQVGRGCPEPLAHCP